MATAIAATGLGLDAFTAAYLEMALATERGIAMWDPARTFTVADIGGRTLDWIVEDCEYFQVEHAGLIGDRSAEAGRAFWLSRNRYVGGFDGVEWGPAGRELARGARFIGEVAWHVGADDKVHQSWVEPIDWSDED